MKKSIITILFLSLSYYWSVGQDNRIPIDTLHWDIQAKSYVLETFKGEQSIYLQGGSMRLKHSNFLNGTIEYDIFLKEVQAFPGVYFRVNGANAEQFYIRPHQSGNPDANQAIPLINGISAWQLYFGEKYSFPYSYHYDDWTHVKLVINNDRAQVYLNYSEKPNLSWRLFHTPKEGGVSLTGGNAQGMHIANIKIDKSSPTIKNFNPLTRTPLEGIIQEWQVSDKFEEKMLDDPSRIESVLKKRRWKRTSKVDEGVAANISSVQQLRDGQPGETVLAKIKIHSDKDQIKLFHFGYSDRVVAILNGAAIYRGNNGWRTRDYRYLGTIGLFDGIYLNLKKGENTLVMAVSESFGGWLITGKFENRRGLTIID